ncbi:hypothetical protein F5Y17DRAFT_266167 [Xylariaceae sp. FL0594]|nr:hypothetical protein F5Y17DRAFT_266167 [Xylariaceae sp. FL0594]
MRLVLGLSALSYVGTLAPDLFLLLGQWPEIALIIVCALHRLSIAATIPICRLFHSQIPAGWPWVAGNTLGAGLQFFGLRLDSLGCRLRNTHRHGFRAAVTFQFGKLERAKPSILEALAISLARVSRCGVSARGSSLGRCTVLHRRVSSFIRLVPSVLAQVLFFCIYSIDSTTLLSF